MPAAATKPTTKKSTAMAKKTAALTSAGATVKPTTTKTKAPAMTTTATTVAKPAPPEGVAGFIGTLPTDAQRYARKAWRHATGQRGTAPSLRGITQEQAKSIRERIAELTR
jgi:hypothetical protein